MLCQTSFVIGFIIAFTIFDIPSRIEASQICKFKSANCVSFDKTKALFKVCRIKAVGRDDNYMQMFADLKVVAHSAIVTITLYKRANGWKPFLYNVTFDGCNFLKNPTAHPLNYFLYSVLARYSNFNHTCPYHGEIIVDKFRMLNSEIKLPFPVGEYAVDTWWKVNGFMLARVNGSCVKASE